MSVLNMVKYRVLQKARYITNLKLALNDDSFQMLNLINGPTIEIIKTFESVFFRKKYQPKIS